MVRSPAGPGARRDVAAPARPRPLFVAAVDREARRALVEGTRGPRRHRLRRGARQPPGSPGHVPARPQQRTLLVHLLNRPVPDGLDAATGCGSRRRAGRPAAQPGAASSGRTRRSPSPAPRDAGPDPLPPGVTPADRLLVDRRAAAAANAARRARARRAHDDRAATGRPTRCACSAADGARRPARLRRAAARPRRSPSPSTAPPTSTAAPPRPPPRRRRRLAAAGLPGPRLRGAARPAARPALDARCRAGPTATPPTRPSCSSSSSPHLGDRLAYWQDAVAVEAYLGTARRRTSVRRHAPPARLRRPRGLLGAGVAGPHDRRDRDAARRGARGRHRAVRGRGAAAGRGARLGGTVFETATDVDLGPGPQRAAAVLLGRPGPRARLPGPRRRSSRAQRRRVTPACSPGDVLVLVDRPAAGPDNPAGGPVDGRPGAAARGPAGPRAPASTPTRCVPTWPCSRCTGTRDDALTRPLVVSRARSRRPAADPGRGAGQRRARRPRRDRRRTSRWTRRSPPPGRPYRPRLPRAGVAFVDPAAVRIPPARVTDGAGALARPDPRTARAALTLDDGERTWTPAARPPGERPARRARRRRARARRRSPGCGSGTASPGARPAAGRSAARYRLGGGRGGQRRRRAAHRLAAARRRDAGDRRRPADGVEPGARDRRHRPRGRWSRSASSRRPPSATSCAP